MEHMALVNTPCTSSGIEQNSSNDVMVCAHMCVRSLSFGRLWNGPAVNCSQKAYIISPHGIQIYANPANVLLQLCIILPLVLLQGNSRNSSRGT
jgi:hypothetical protein